MYTFHKASLKQCFTICLRTETILNSFSSTLTTYFRRTLLLRNFTLASKRGKILNHPVKILPLKLLTKSTSKHKKQRNKGHLHNMHTIFFISVLYKFCLDHQSQVMIKFAHVIQDWRLDWAGEWLWAEDLRASPSGWKILTIFYFNDAFLTYTLCPKKVSSVNSLPFLKKWKDFNHMNRT